jgi:hypothetical protein
MQQHTLAGTSVQPRTENTQVLKSHTFHVYGCFAVVVLFVGFAAAVFPGTSVAWHASSAAEYAAQL